MNEYCRSHWLLEVEDVCPAELLNAMAERNLAVFAPEPLGRLGLRFCVLHRDIAPVRALLAARGTRLLSCTLRGPRNVIRRLLRRKPALILSVLLTALLILSTMFVWRIELEGNDRIPDYALLSALQESGAGIGSFWPGFDGEQLQTALYLALPELQWVGLSYGSGVLCVSVREKRPAENLEPPGRPRDLVAVCDGLVTDILPLRGRAVAEVGDTVSRGQVLLSRVTESRNGAPRQVSALGTVTARTWHSFTAVQALHVEKKQYTGRVFHRLSLNLGQNRVKFYLGSSFSPPTCDKITLDYHLCLDGVFALPLGLTVETYREFTPVESVRPPKQQEALAKDALLARLQLAADDGEILRTEFAARRRQDCLAVTVTGECLQNIAVPAPESRTELRR